MTPDFEALHRERVARHSASPFLTYYDDTTGERTELSYATFDNWVSKTANYLVDGLGVGHGDTVATVLPPHWQGVAITFAAWCAGATVVALDPDDDALGEHLRAAGSRAVFAAEAALDGVRAAGLLDPPADIVGLSLRPFAAPLERVLPGVSDYAEEVPAYADSFTPVAPLQLDEFALVTYAGSVRSAFTVRDLTAPAETLPAAGGRLASALPLAGAGGARGWALGPVAAWWLGTGVLLDRAPDPETWPRRAATERVAFAALPAGVAAAVVAALAPGDPLLVVVPDDEPGGTGYRPAR